MSINFMHVDRKKQKQTGHWEEFHNSPTAPGSHEWQDDCKRSALGKKLASNRKARDEYGNEGWEEDVRGYTGFLFCRICPSCKGLDTFPVFLDVQCHELDMRDNHLTMPDFVRIGDWSAVRCDECGVTSKFGNWYDEDMKIRPTETVFREGSVCWSIRRDMCQAFLAGPRKKDGQLIWRFDGQRDCNKQIGQCVGRVNISNPNIVSKFLDIPYIENIKHNDLVRTRTDAAKAILASI